MNLNNLKPGLRLAVECELSKREIAVFLLLIDKPMTCEDLAIQLGLKQSNTHNILFSLRTNQLVCFKDKTVDGKILYGVCDDL